MVSRLAVASALQLVSAATILKQMWALDHVTDKATCEAPSEPYVDPQVRDHGAPTSWPLNGCVEKCPTCMGVYVKWTCDGSTLKWNQYRDEECSSKDFFSTEYTYTNGECMTGVDIGTSSSLSGAKMYTLEGECEKADDPCFSRLTTACRLVDVSADPAAAFAACFEVADGAVAERVNMTELRAGDYVLSDEMNKASRVVVNQHKAAESVSTMVLIEHAAGSLELTPDHVLKADGVFVAAREVAAGSMLGEHKVVRVSRTLSGVINPITVAGTILAAGPEGEPVIASTYPEWIAAYMLSSAMPLPFSTGNALAYLFPEAAQAFYDRLVEPLFPASGGSYRAYLERIPDSLKPLAFVGGDLTVSAAFALYLSPIAALSACVILALNRAKA